MTDPNQVANDVKTAISVVEAVAVPGVSVMDAVLGFLKALPQLLTMIQHGWAFLVKISGNDPAGFIAKAGPVFQQLAQAESQEDHQNAAKNLSDLISKLPAK